MLTHWLSGFLPEMHFWTSWRFSGWMWVKLALIYSKRHLQHDSKAFFPQVLCFTTFLLRNLVFWTRKRPTSLLGFSFFNFFFTFHFFPFLFCYSDWPSTWLASGSKKILRKHHRGSQFLPYHGVATCSCREFCSEYFTPMSKHFHAYFRLYRADHSDLGIIEKIFSFCRSWV